MRIALCFRGIHFCPKFYNKHVDYRKCFQNNLENLINPLKEKHSVDIYLFTYNSILRSELINDYKPKEAVFLDENEMLLGGTFHRQLFFHKILIEKIKESEIKNNFKYDSIFIMRFDIYYMKNINEWNVDYNKVNAVFEHVHNCDNYRHTDDNLFIISREHLDEFYNGVMTTYNNNDTTHRICVYINSEYMHYIYTITQEDLDNNTVYKLYSLGREFI